jgi:carbon monoxide dehydrogenase subunit G
MKLERSFVIRAPVERVWEMLTDVERVAPCLPGAEITERGEDDAYRGTFTVKLGPTTAAYRGTVEMVDADEAARRATLRAAGQDQRGQGSARMTMVSTLHEVEEGTRVDVDTDFVIGGRLARFGRGGMIEDVSDRLLRDFSACLQARMSPPEGSAEAPQQTAKPIGGVSLFFAVLWQRIKRLLGGGRASRG